MILGKEEPGEWKDGEYAPVTIANQITHLPSELKQLVKLRSLELSGNPLGELPEIVFELKELEFLGIANVGLSIVPEQIAQLVQLKRLYLHSNQLTEIPRSIAQLTQLTELSLSNNQLTEISESIGQLIQLERFSVSGGEIKEIPDSIGQLINLTELLIYRTQVEVIPEAIGCMVNLTKLYLNRNQITKIPDSTSFLTNIMEIWLECNQIMSISDSIGLLTNLKILHLFSNKITVIPNSIGLLTSLTQLSLSGNQITNIPDSITQLTNLTILSLWHNKITVIPDSISKLVKLTALYLSYNQIAIIPDSIAQLTNLTDLELHTNQITVIPDSIAQLFNLKELSLWNNQIAVIPDSIAQLTNLTDLKLHANQITVIPDSIARLINLSTLNISNNQITVIPDSMAQLTNLTELSLHINQITVIPDSIAQLTNLTTLNLHTNQITIIPDSIAQLTNLTELYLSTNQITVIPDSIAQLSNLTELYLSTNQIKVIPDSVAQLTNLVSLDLDGNQITIIPDSIAQLTNLKELWLHTNQITIIPDSIAQLTNLIKLDLYKNQITVIPDSIAQLTNLIKLDLYKNQITVIPDSIAQLNNLAELDLWSNRIQEVPKWITSLAKLEQLDLRKNPLSIPKDILDSDAETREENKLPAAKPIFDYLLLTQDPDEINHLYETKLLFVGEGESGKTSLAKKLLNPEYKLTSDSPSTKGIDILRWEFKGTNGNDYRIHLWDFGGQEIYHQTHQFFLTESALYLLLADSRKEDTDHPYWLNIIRLRSKNSPVLLIQNEKNDRHCNLNLRELRHEFTSLETPAPINLATDRNLPELTKEIKHQLEKLLGKGLQFPNKWLNIRNILENENRNHLSLTEYQTLCTRNGITNEVEMLQLSAFLHRLGTCFHFQSDLNLKQLLILKPNWGTAACYKILDCDRVRTNLGQFTNEDLSNIWSDKQYTGLQPQLLQLMKEFKICYEIPKNPGKYIAPHLLSIAPPDYDWNPNNNLILRYQYPGFMPKGILTRFIVDMHKQIENVEIPNSAHVWKTGVILNKNNARAEIVENTIHRHIEIRLTGTRPRDLFTLINHHFQDIHDDYDQLKYDTLIPCNCPQCKNTTEPYTYTLKSLETRLDKRQYTVQCDKSYETVQVRRLIEDVLSIQDDDPDINEPDFDRSNEYDRPRNSPGKRSDRYNKPTPIVVENHFHNTNQQDQTMSNDKIWNGDRVETKIQGDQVMGNKMQIETVQGDAIAGNKILNSQNLTQAAQDIKTLLDQISATDTTTNPTLIAIKAIEAIENNPTLKDRIINAGKEAGFAALDAAVDHPAIKIVTAAIKGAMV